MLSNKVSDAIVDISKGISAVAINEIYSKIIFKRSLKWIFYSSFKMSILCNQYDEFAVHSKILSSVFTVFSTLKQLIVSHGYKSKKTSYQIMSYLNENIRPFLAKWDNKINHTKSKKIKKGIIIDDELKEEFKFDIEELQKKAENILKEIYKKILIKIV